MAIGPLNTVASAYVECMDRPLSTRGLNQPGAYRYFYASGTLVLVPVYADAELKAALVQQSLSAGPGLAADNQGKFPVIYLDPSIEYRSQLYDPTGVLLEDVDPVNITNNAFPVGQNGLAPGGIIVSTNPLGVPVYVYKNTNRTVNGYTVSDIPNLFGPDPELQVVVLSAGTYRIEANIVLTTTFAQAANISIQFIGPLPSTAGLTPADSEVFAMMGSTNFLEPAGPNGDGYNTLQIGAGVGTLGTTLGSNTYKLVQSVRVLGPGVFVVAFNPGSLGSSTPITMQAGSSMEVIRLN